MTTATYSYSTTLTVVTCGECGIPHGLPKNLQAARYADGGLWYCPNGHRIGYNETEAQRLKQELKWASDDAARVRAERDQIEASRRAWKGQVTRLRNRAVEGDCPLCGQHLRDLARHMGRIHPDETARELDETEATAE